MEGRAVSELQEIVGAIRQVERTMERRHARAEGAFLTLWGLGVAAIFLFYRAAHANPAPFEALLGPLVDWMWLAPFAVCYAATLVLGARFTPVVSEGGRIWRDPYALVAIVGTSILVLGGRALAHPEWSTGAIILFGGAMLAFRTRKWGPAPARAGFALAALALPCGVAMFFLDTTLVTHAVAAAYWGIAWPLAGAVVYWRGG